MPDFSELYRFLPAFKGKKRFGRMLFRKAVYNNIDKIIRCKNGLQFHLLNTQDSVGRDLFFDGEYEPETVDLALSLLKDGDVMVDAGANIGPVCLPVAKKRNVQVYAFEPARHISEILKKNIAINNLTNVTLEQIALSDAEETREFYESDRVHGWSGMVKIDSFQHYRVNTTTLDSFSEKNGVKKIKVLKADVQGWEYFVFKGAENLIDEGRIEHIVFELEWWAEKNAGLEIGTAQRFLMDKGYRLETLKGKKITEPLKEGSLMIHAWK